MNFNQEISRKSGYFVFIILIILVSFRLFSTIFYPLVNSDEGVIVLMLHYFKLPHDLYFWGQNRYGAIIPLLGQIPYRLFGFSSLISEAITHYVILIAGFFAFSSFIKSNLNRILFAAVWFLPPLYDTDLLRNVFGLQYSLIGILFFLIYKYQSKFQSKGLAIKLLYYLLLLVITIMAFWVSDLAITSILAFLLVSIYFQLRERKINTLLSKSETYLVISGLLLTFLLIRYLKTFAEVSPFDRYNEKLLLGIPATIESGKLLLSTIGSILSFQIPDFLISIYSWLIILIVILTSIFYKKIKPWIEVSRWAAVFILDGLILIIVLLVSNWASLNGMPRRYFVGAYISFWLAFLVLLSYFDKGRIKNVITILAVLVISIGAVSTVYSYKYIFPKSLTPKVDLVREFDRLGKIGIIADYWNSYGTSFANPDLIKATPNEYSGAVRNQAMADSVFAQPKIILIKDMWMDDFPDTIRQFGRTLIRKDSAFFIGDCWVNEYTISRE